MEFRTMLVLSRRPNEKILFPTLGVTVEITSICKNVVRIGIDAPPSVSIVREEIASESDKLAVTKPANHRMRNRLHAASLAVHVALTQLHAGLAKESENTLNEALRQYEELDRELSNEKAEKAAKSKARPDIRTLLVEDDRNESVLLAEFLRLHGIDVQMAQDGQEALDYLRSHERPDVILLDMRMPRCDGPSTLAAIRGDAAYDKTKVFAVSGSSKEELSLPFGLHGLDGWFTKPVNPRKLIHEMNHALGRN
jgi:carbon storage regulator CsrA